MSAEPKRPTGDAALRLVLLHDVTGAEFAIPAGDIIEVRAVHPDTLAAVRSKGDMDASAEVVTVNRYRPEAPSVAVLVLETVAQVVAVHNAVVSAQTRPTLMLFRQDGGRPKLVGLAR